MIANDSTRSMRTHYSKDLIGYAPFLIGRKGLAEQMRAHLLYYLVALTSAAPAYANTMIANHPGVMCESAEALSKLTSPDGSSRAAMPAARPVYLAAKQAGGCIDIPPGAEVEVITARKNTSIVTYDAHDGRGNRTFIVPNIDFVENAAGVAATAQSSHVQAWPDRDYPPLANANRLFAAVQSRCPQQGWDEHSLSHAEIGPWDAIGGKLTAAQRKAIDREIAKQCDAGLACPADITFGMEVQMGHFNALVDTICSQKAS